MEYRGSGEGAVRTAVDGDLDAAEFIAYWLDDEDDVLAAMNVNVWDAGDELEAAGRSRARFAGPATGTTGLAARAG
jgi:hypothetical protein